jgi:hypothetical protein
VTWPAPVFPPLLCGVAVAGADDPFDHARALAVRGCDGGTVVHNVQADRLRAAIVFAPEVALGRAMAMLPVCGLGFQNALGALAPPEVAVHLDWAGGILVNGATCGRLRAAALAGDPLVVPDWLVIGLDLAIVQTAADPGANPQVTALYDEGCAEVDPLTLLEAWVRHSLVWISRWEDEGNAPVHRDWSGLLMPAVGQGAFIGLDEDFGMLIGDGGPTRLRPLHDIVEVTP